MTNFDRAVLVVERDNRTGVFEMRKDLTPTVNTNRNFVLGGRGGIVNEIQDLVTDTQSREEFFVDLGTGVRRKTLEFSLNDGSGSETLQWGDGSSDASDPDDITKWDATAARSAETKWQIFDYWLSETNIDSNAPATLHYGQYADGTRLSEDGVYEPLSVTVPEWTMEKPTNNASSLTVTLTMRLTAEFEIAGDAASNDQR